MRTYKTQFQGRKNMARLRQCHVAASRAGLAEIWDGCGHIVRPTPGGNMDLYDYNGAVCRLLLPDYATEILYDLENERDELDAALAMEREK